MCGIAGLLGDDPDKSASIQKMCRIIRHRGPDDAGFAFFEGAQLVPHIAGDEDTPALVYAARAPYLPEHSSGNNPSVDAQIALGHRRLAIVDTSALGHQPMCFGEGRYWISYNGELYNHVELRAELEAKGHTFISRSDTEVVLAAYAEWGAECLARFNGMWGLAILDRSRRTLFLARDRFGVKPIYYWISSRGFLAFASEIKQFTVLPGWHARLNGQRAYDFLVWFPTDHTDETLFDRVYQLPPGTCATLDVDRWKESVGPDGRITLTHWYPFRAETFAGDLDEAATEYRRRLTDSIRIRLRADVAVGYALSGGLDSSSVVCVAHRLLEEEGASVAPRTFSMCADNETFNERKWAELVAAAVNADATYTSPSGEGLLGALPTMTWHQDEPFGSPAVYGQWCVFREAAAAGVKVLLGGHGSDEPLAGYPSFYPALFLALLRKARFLTMVREARALRQLHGYSLMLAPRLLVHSILPPAGIDWIRRALRRDTSSPPWIDAKRLRADTEDPLSSARSLGNRSSSALSRILLTRAPSPMVLHYEDRSSMAHSFESRQPFLDYRLVEFALGLPDEFKLHRGVHKRLLRRAMTGILPDATRMRTNKVGMATPNEAWILRSDPKAFKQKLDAAIDAGQGILTPYCRDYYEDVAEGRRPFDQVLWRMIAFGEWLKIFRVATT